jgi:hypothetical protein
MRNRLYFAQNLIGRIKGSAEWLLEIGKELNGCPFHIQSKNCRRKDKFSWQDRSIIFAYWI